MESSDASRSISRSSTALDLKDLVPEKRHPTMPPQVGLPDVGITSDSALPRGKEILDAELHDAVGRRFLVQMEGEDDPRDPQNWPYVSRTPSCAPP
jgi:hypothetical protein